MRNSNTLFGLAGLLLVMTLLPGNRTHAQESKKNSPCISVETLETMLHLPISDVFDIMAEKDYQMGSITDTITDTVDNFPLRYMRTGFYHFSKSGNIEVLLMESLDGLSNYVQFSMKHKGECDFISDLLNHAYTLNSVKSVFVGTKPVKGRIERYECKVLQDQDTSLWVQLKNVDEITKYITPQKKAAVDRVKKAMARADVLRNAGKFAEAFSTLDSVMDYYPPMNDSIRITYQLVEYLMGTAGGNDDVSLDLFAVFQSYGNGSAVFNVYSIHGTAVHESAAVFLNVVSQSFWYLLNTANDVVEGRIILIAFSVIYVNAVIKGCLSIGKWYAEAVDFAGVNAEVCQDACIYGS